MNKEFLDNLAKLFIGGFNAYFEENNVTPTINTELDIFWDARMMFRNRVGILGFTHIDEINIGNSIDCKFEEAFELQENIPRFAQFQKARECGNYLVLEAQKQWNQLKSLRDWMREIGHSV